MTVDTVDIGSNSNTSASTPADKGACDCCKVLKQDQIAAAVSSDEGQRYAASIGAPWYECSAKDRGSVEDIFRAVTKQCVIEATENKAGCLHGAHLAASATDRDVATESTCTVCGTRTAAAAASTLWGMKAFRSSDRSSSSKQNDSSCSVL